MSGYGYNIILTSLVRCSSTASNFILGRIKFAGIIVKKAKQNKGNKLQSFTNIGDQL